MPWQLTLTTPPASLQEQYIPVTGPTGVQPVAPPAGHRQAQDAGVEAQVAGTG
jgi:hypothetical protein